MKNIKRNTLIIFLVTLIVLYFALKDHLSQVLSTLWKLDLKYLFLAVLFYILYLFLKALVNYISIKEKKKVTLWEAFRHTIITQFFNGITPFSTGGQPMEIYMLHEHGIRPTRATNIIMQNFIFYQVALVLFGFCAVLYNQWKNVLIITPFLKSLIWIGFLINIGVALFLFFVAASKKFTKTFVGFLLRIGKKLHFVKDFDQQKKIWEDRLNDFHKYTQELKAHKSLFVFGVVANFLALLCFYAIPFFIVYSLHDFTSLHFLEAITASAYVLVMGSFIPIPGASGGIEYGFVQLFGKFIQGSNMSVVLLVWRFITYYLGMILGAICFNFHQRKGERKE